jgi:SAM-dependent methyltransferase
MPRAVNRFGNHFRTAALLSVIGPELQRGGRLIDIGAGSCHLAQAAARRFDIDVTAVDVTDHNLTDLPLKIYDGRTLPYKDGSFDTALLSFVLHHADDPARVLNEALRVAGRVIVLEDTPGGRLQAAAWRTLDYALNHAQHKDVAVAHAARSAGEWREFFAARGAEVVTERRFRRAATNAWLYAHDLFVLRKSVPRPPRQAS